MAFDSANTSNNIQECVREPHTLRSVRGVGKKKSRSIQSFFQPVGKGLVKRPEMSRLTSEQFQQNLQSLSPLEKDTIASTVVSSASGLMKKQRDFNLAWQRAFPWVHMKVVDGGKVLKCQYCVQYHVDGPWGKGSGCTTFQRSALRTHADSESHKFARTKWLSSQKTGSKSMVDHVNKITDANKGRVLVTMKLMYHTARCGLSICSYEPLCQLAQHLGVSSMPTGEYGSYTNMVSGREFILVTSTLIEEEQENEMRRSPYFSLMVDESTDRSHEKHLIVHGTYLSAGGVGPPKTCFLKLLGIADGTSAMVYSALVAFMESKRLDRNKLIGIAIDGASSMMGLRTGLVARLKVENPKLIAIHCIAHREALAAADAAKEFQELQTVDKLAQRVYKWTGASSLRTKEMYGFMNEMGIQILSSLQLHGVRWLSRGQVMVRLVKVLPAILEMWSKSDDEKARRWYQDACRVEVIFYLHILADILTELNKLNSSFQKENIDPTTLGTLVDNCINSLRRMFLRENRFGEEAVHTWAFEEQIIRSTENPTLVFMDRNGLEHVHNLGYEELFNTGVRDVRPCLVRCKVVIGLYIRKVVDSLTDRYPDLPLFNALKVFSPRHYTEDLFAREAQTNLWLCWLLEHFGYVMEQGMDEVQCIFDGGACLRNLHSFVDTLRSNCENFTLMEAWRVFCSHPEWHELDSGYYELMQLWQGVLCIPTSTASCERGFSTQNIIKSIKRTSLSLETLDCLMRIMLVGLDVPNLNWNRAFDIWKDVKDVRGRQIFGADL